MRCLRLLIPSHIAKRSLIFGCPISLWGAAVLGIAILWLSSTVLSFMPKAPFWYIGLCIPIFPYLKYLARLDVDYVSVRIAGFAYHRKKPLHRKIEAFFSRKGCVSYAPF